jgi:hypothetical protein
MMHNPAVLLVIVALATRVYAAWNRSRAKGAPPVVPPAGGDDERTRRVREEVARKIAERRAGLRPSAPAPEEEDLPAFPPDLVPARTDDIDAAVARQRALGEQIRALEAASAASAVSARPAAAAASAPPVPTAADHRFPELADPRSARRAVVLREILGAPRGLSVDGCLWR